MSVELYPIKLTDCIRRYDYGGRRIPDTYPAKRLPDGTIAETWEISDHGDDVSTVRNGPLAGRSLRELVTEYESALLGRNVAASPRGTFPLLIKLLDAQRTLTMQVHPDDEFAAAHEPGENGKTEAWYVVDADEGATLFCGNVNGLTRERLRYSVEAGNPEPAMKEIPVSRGDAIYVPAGRMHAIGAGILIYEAQQSCDTTYIPYPRAGQDEAAAKQGVEKFIEACHLEDLGEQRIAPVVLETGSNQRNILLANRYFAMERLDLHEPWLQALDGSHFLAYTALKGGGVIEHQAGKPVEFAAGESVLVPASVGDFRIIPNSPTELLVAYVPDLMTDIVRPLRAAGVPDAAIAQLGGPGAPNDVVRVLA